MLRAAYLRRQEWLAERQVVHTIHLLGLALGGSKSGSGRRQTRGTAQRVPPGHMFKQLGQEI
jgi:hypothetical protein